MLRWPSELPNPTSRQYSGEPLPAVARTDSDRGELRVRSIASYTPERVSLAWVMTGAEMRIARAFYRYALHNGADSCTMSLYMDGQGYVDRIVKFESDPKWAIRGVDTWTVSAELRVTDRFSLTLNREMTYADNGASPTPELDPGDLPALLAITRVDVWIPEPFNGSTTNKLNVGWSGDSDAIVNDLDLTTVTDEPISVVAGHAYAGVAIGAAQIDAKSITAIVTSTAGATAGRCVIVAYYGAP